MVLAEEPQKLMNLHDFKWKDEEDEEEKVMKIVRIDELQQWDFNSLQAAEMKDLYKSEVDRFFPCVLTKTSKPTKKVGMNEPKQES